MGIDTLKNPSTSLPPIAVLPLIGTELGKQANWKAALPDGSSLLVTLRQLNPTEAAMVLHPVGTLKFAKNSAAAGCGTAAGPPWKTLRVRHFPQLRRGLHQTNQCYTRMHAFLLPARRQHYLGPGRHGLDRS